MNVVMMLEKSRCQVVDSHQFRLDGRIAARAFLRSVLCPSKCTSAPHYPRDYLILHDSGAAIHLGLSNPEGATRVQNCKVTMWSTHATFAILVSTSITISYPPFSYHLVNASCLRKISRSGIERHLPLLPRRDTLSYSLLSATIFFFTPI